MSESDTVSEKTLEERNWRNSAKALVRGLVLGRGKTVLYVISVGTALIGLLLGLSEYADKRMAEKRKVAQEQYAMVVDNLGSESLVVRVGALGQLPTLLRRGVPEYGPGSRATDGLLYLLGGETKQVTYPYQDDLLRVIRALVAVPKSGRDGNELESEAFLDMLCQIGAEGWYRAEMREEPPRSEECLAWLWSDAPQTRRFNIPSYPLFRGSSLASMNFSRKILKRAEFSRATIRGGTFSDSTLTRSHFNRAKLWKVSFANADLRYADFSNANLQGVNFSGASLQYASFRGAVFGGSSGIPVVFDQANLAGADFRDAELTNLSLEHALNVRLTQGLSGSARQVGESGAEE